jgi:hypothetical protein
MNVGELAVAINHQLFRLERDPDLNYERKGRRPFMNASASVVDGQVKVSCRSYGDADLLDTTHAAAYLAALANGFVGAPSDLPV